MPTLAGLAQCEDSAARHDLAAVLQENLNQVFEVAQLGLAIHQRHHVHTKGVLQLSLLVEVVQHDLRNLAALELDHHPHARLI